MTRRVAFRQCDVARAARVAKAMGDMRVVIRPDGTLVLEPTDVDQGTRAAAESGAVAGGKGKEIVL